MDTHDLAQSQNESIYEPTADQVARAAALRRFNLLYIYLPIGLLSAIVVTLVVLLLIVAINPPSVEALLLISGLADVALIIALLPVVLFGAVLLGLIGYAYVEGRKRGTAPVKQTQRLLWRMDNLVGRVRVRTDQAASSIIQPFLSANGAFAYLRTLLRTLITQLTNMVKRS